ncbi:trypsin-1-like [Zophobas morio]|uniref:trypsin-1-like n=1 Tax=Zophobas morio TaxID=2755281 RepID=UPI003082D480
MKTFLFIIVLVAAVSAKPSSQRLNLPLFRPSLRVVNGEDAAPGQFPHQITYQWGFRGVHEHVCGGSIISETWILTAGHCITEVPEDGDHIVIAGITNLYEDTTEKQTINVTRKIVHPNYVGGVAPNDIALLQLESPLTFGDLVKPIALPEAGSVATGDTVSSGWGSISPTNFPLSPTQLQTATLPLVSFDECNSVIEALLGEDADNPLSEDSNVCTLSTAGVSSCSGDSGGPLIQDNIVLGIVSWGFVPCGYEGAPSVYTRVSNFIDFINEYVTDLPK